MVIRGSDVKFEDEILNTLTIYIPVPDARDGKQKKYKATLLSDGSGIRVMMPSMPFYFIQAVDAIHSLEVGGDTDAGSASTAICEQTKLKHLALATAMRTTRTRQVKELVFRFPDKMTCTNSHYNKRKSPADLKLKNNLRMLDVEVDKDADGDPVIHTMTFIFWKVVIEGEVQKLEAAADSESDDDWTEATKRMSHMRLG
jgi:hypothetical protein